MGDKIFERLGVYDILGVLLSGICMVSATVFLSVQCGLLDKSLLDMNAWVFLIVSYVVGLVFQELTHVLQGFVNKIEDRKNVDKKKGERSLYENNILLRKAVIPKFNHALYMEEKEVFDIQAEVIRICKLEEGEFNWNIAYNVCRAYMAQNGSSARTDRDQALSAMARSMSLFCLLALCFPVWGLFHEANTWFCIIAIVVLIGLTLLFYNRFKRFAHRRYITILRFFLYNVKIKENGNEQKNCCKCQSIITKATKKVS